MHEYSIVQALLDQCENIAKENEASTITKVVTKIGAMSGVETHLLQTAFDTFKEGTMCENAEFIINYQKIKLRCNDCSNEFEIDESWIRLNVAGYKKNNQEEKLSPIPYYEKAFLKAFIEDRFPLPIEISPNVFVSEEVSRIYSILRTMDRRDPGVIQLQFPELSDFLAEVLLSGFSEEELKMAVCKTLSKEIERRMKKTHKLHEKKELKKLVFDLKKGNLEKLSSVVFKITG